MVTQPRQPLITKREPLSSYTAITSQKLGRADHLLDSLDKVFAIGKSRTYDYPNPGLQKFYGQWAISTIATQTNVQDRLLNLLLSKDTFFRGAGRGPTYDYPNPTLGKERHRDLLTHTQSLVSNTLQSKDKFFRSAGQGPSYDYPNPRGYIPSIDLRTHLQSSVNTTLRGKDTFFRGPGIGPNYDYPNPLPTRGLRTQEASGPNLLTTLLTIVLFPANQYQWPNPSGYQYPIQLRTHLDLLRSYDPGEIPKSIFDWPNPKGYQYPSNLRTHLDVLKFYNSGEYPKSISDWIVPKGPVFPISLRLHGTGPIPNLLLPPFNLSQWPNPSFSTFPLSLRTFIDPAKQEVSVIVASPFILTSQPNPLVLKPLKQNVTFQNIVLTQDIFSTPDTGNIMPYRRHRRRSR